MKILLRTLEVIIVLFILIIFILFVVGLIITRPEKLKPIIAQQVYQLTGRQITFNGKLHWSFSPIGIEATNVTLSNPKGFSKAAMMSVNAFNFHVEFWPLFKGKIHTTEIVVDGLKLNLIQTKNGNNNWEMAASQEQAQAATANNRQKPATTTSSSDHEADFSIPSLKLKNAIITWENQQTAQHMTIDQLNLTASTISANKNSDDLNDFLRHMTVNAKMNVKKITVSNLVLQNIAAKMTAKNGSINISPITAKLYRGNYQGQLQIDATGSTPKITTHADIQNVQLKPLLNDLSGRDEITGTVHINGQLTAYSFNKDQFLKSMNGHVEARVLNGTLQGVNFIYFGQTLLALIKGERPSAEQGGNVTAFSSLNAAGPIRNGMLNLQTLSMRSPVLHVDGNGTANLIHQQLDLLLNVTLVKGNEPLAPALPVKVTGSFNDPAFAPEYQAILQNVTKHVVEKHLRDTINDKLKDLNLNFLSS